MAERRIAAWKQHWASIWTDTRVLRNFDRELDGSEGIHCVENRPENDYAKLTYPIEGEYLISKRRYSAFGRKAE